MGMSRLSGIAETPGGRLEVNSLNKSGRTIGYEDKTE